MASLRLGLGLCFSFLLSLIRTMDYNYLLLLGSSAPMALLKFGPGYQHHIVAIDRPCLASTSSRMRARPSKRRSALPEGVVPTAEVRAGCALPGLAETQTLEGLARPRRSDVAADFHRRAIATAARGSPHRAVP